MTVAAFVDGAAILEAKVCDESTTAGDGIAKDCEENNGAMVFGRAEETTGTGDDRMVLAVGTLALPLGNVTSDEATVP